MSDLHIKIKLLLGTFEFNSICFSIISIISISLSSDLSSSSCIGSWLILILYFAFLFFVFKFITILKFWFNIISPSGFSDMDSLK